MNWAIATLFNISGFICQKSVHFTFPQIAVLTSFFQVFIELGMFNFVLLLPMICDQVYERAPCGWMGPLLHCLVTRLSFNRLLKGKTNNNFTKPQIKRLKEFFLAEANSYCREDFQPCQLTNVSTTPITAMECRQRLPLGIIQLKGKHCQKPHCRNGFLDTFALDLLFS